MKITTFLLLLFSLSFTGYFLLLASRNLWWPQDSLMDANSIEIETPTIRKQKPLLNVNHDDKAISSMLLPPTRIIAVGDLHGDLRNSLEVLKMTGIVRKRTLSKAPANEGERWEWNGGDNSILVQTGDIVDRGDDTLAIYTLFERLGREALLEGGRSEVVRVLGNHEVMNIEGDWRYVTPGDIKSFGGMAARRKAWSSSGELGQSLRKLSVTALVNSTVFFHGGAVGRFAKAGVAGLSLGTDVEFGEWDAQHPDGVEGDVSGGKKKGGSGGRIEGLFGNDGPLWYRGYANDPAKSLCPKLHKALKHLGASRMVVGHTPQLEKGILERCGGGVFVIDVGISRVYGGHFAALEIVGDRVTGIYPGGKRIPYN